MNKIDLFSTPLIEFEWDDAEELNSGLIEHIYKMDDSVVNGLKQSYSMVGGKHTDFTLFEGERTDAVVEFHKRISDLIMDYGHNYIDPNFKDTVAPTIRMTPWCMVYGPNDYSSTHNHPGIDLAITYYPQVPYTDGNNGNLNLYDPRAGAAWDYNYTNQSIQSFKPKQGGGFMFPGWLQHGTTPHRGDGDRICIAINVKFNRA